MENVKLIIIDIDGTLTNSKKIITEYTKSIIKKVKEKGIYVVLCSGRTNMYVISKTIESNGSNFIISSNGSLVYDYVNEYKIYEEVISNDEIKDLYNYCLMEKIGVKLNATSNRYHNKYIVDIKECSGEYNELCNDCITQFYIEVKDKNKLESIKNYISKSNVFEIVNYCTKGIDVVKLGVSKGRGISKLLDYLKISSDEVLCFGDSDNDISMFNVCKYKIAMKNSSMRILSLADYVTLSNDEDGVAHFIENNVVRER